MDSDLIYPDHILLILKLAGLTDLHGVNMFYRGPPRPDEQCLLRLGNAVSLWWLAEKDFVAGFSAGFRTNTLTSTEVLCLIFIHAIREG